MARWNGYLRVDRITANLNEENFATLIEAMQDLGPQSVGAEGALGQPVNVMHDRPNIADPPTAYIFQANFDPSEVTIETWKEAMAELFGVDPNDIGDTFEDVSYSDDGRETREWTFSYPDGVTDRVVFARYGRGSTQFDSKKEMHGDLYANAAEWGETVG